MGVEDLILRLMIEEDNKLLKKKVNSFSIATMKNMVEQVTKPYKKNNQNACYKKQRYC
jgi:hypothetical protein